MLQATNLTKTYHKKTVLRNACFTLPPGHCLGIAGHNGSGKSTLMALVAQVLAPTSGDITFNGKQVLNNREFMRTSLGYVPQGNCLLDDLTVQETLRFWQKSYGLAKSNIFASGAPATILGLAPIAKKRVSALSGGMQKRVSIAIALLHNPQFLLLDEVLSSLDRQYRQELFAYLKNYREQGGSILYCSHEAEDLYNFCDSVLVLRSGQTVFNNSIQEFPVEAESLNVLLSPLPVDSSE